MQMLEEDVMGQKKVMDICSGDVGDMLFKGEPALE